LIPAFPDQVKLLHVISSLRARLASCRADRLVTFNLRHLTAAAQRFGIQAMTPPEAWREMQRRNEKK
jgi:hypothetical protein